MPETVHSSAHLYELGFHHLHPVPLLLDDAAQLLVYQPHQLPDVSLREDVLSQLLGDEPLEARSIESWRIARSLAPLQQRLTDVVGEPPALRLLTRERLAAGFALEEATEQVVAGGAARVHPGRGLGLQDFRCLRELGRRHDGRKGVFYPSRRKLVLGVHTPDERSRVGLAREHTVDRCLLPALPLRAGYALIVEHLGDVQNALALAGHVEHASDDAVRRRVELQPGALLGSVLDQHPPVAIGNVRRHPEPARSGLSHAARDFLREVLAVELVDALDDRLHELASRGVVGVFGDGDDADTAPAEHRLEGDGMLALAGEAGELPDEDLLEGSLGTAGRVQHAAELGAVGRTTALGLIHVLASDGVAVLLGVVPQCSQLGRDRKVHILAVTGDTCVEGGGLGRRCLRHVVVLLCVGGVAA